ncbi:succinyl-diaminopimelate desuccinylase, partial [bacterium]|nr:succinyl-diaminopimelate desuccinylase [bacterium]
MPSYAVQLAQKLVRCPSVTPVEGGALDVLQDEFTKLGFDCTRLPFGAGEKRIDNLFARRGTGEPHFAFAGHTDVVPVGDAAQWQHDPFGGMLVDGKLYGRGAADMKGGIAAFVAAVSALDGADDTGSISFIITGDEEGDADFGTVKMVEWLQANDQVPDACVVGEPTNPSRLGDVIKNGRRGSLSCQLRVDGVQGHVAYPHLADNPITRLIAMLAPVNGTALDGGNDYFDPSTANVTSIDTGNEAGNVIPASVSAKFNIRFNTEHKSDDLIGWLEEYFNRVGGEWTATWRASAQPFVTPVGSFTALMQTAIESVTGQKPVLSTNGGT